MSIWKRQLHIKHPDWVLSAAGSIAKTAELAAARRMPECLEGAMFVVPARRLLRGVYGSDLRAAWALLRMALHDAVVNRSTAVKWWWLFRVRGIDPEVYFDGMAERLEKQA